MKVILTIPDEVALHPGGEIDLTDDALAGAALVEFRAGRLTGGELEIALLSKLRSLFTLARRDVEADVLVAAFDSFRHEKRLEGLDPVELVHEGRR